MKLLKISLILALSLFSLQSFAFKIYNNTKETMYVFDKTFNWDREFSATLKPGESAACNPKAKACQGNLALNVVVVNPGGVSFHCAMWNGSVKKETGHYFIITRDKDHELQGEGWCQMNHYRS